MIRIFIYEVITIRHTDHKLDVQTDDSHAFTLVSLIPGYYCELIRNSDASFEMTSSTFLHHEIHHLRTLGEVSYSLWIILKSD